MVSDYSTGHRPCRGPGRETRPSAGTAPSAERSGNVPADRVSSRSIPLSREPVGDRAIDMATIAIGVNSLRGGGVERTVLKLARELLGRGHRVDLLFRRVICDYPNDVPNGLRFFCVTQSIAADAVEERRRELEASDVFRGAVIPAPKIPDWKLRYANVMLALYWRRWRWPLFKYEEHARVAFRVAAYLDSERPDALLATGIKPPIWAVCARQIARYRVRTVATLDGWPAEKTARMAPCVYPYTDAVIAVSHGCARFVTDVLKARVPVHTVYYPLVGPEELCKAAEPVDHPWIGGDLPVILSAGSLKKDYPNLLQAVAILGARRPVRLIILARREEPWLGELQQRARSLGIAEAVDFPGFVDNPYAFMANADLFVLSSLREGMPQVLVQAMMTGCKVVATDCTAGPAELLGKGEYGRLAPVGDPEALAEAMERELDDPRDAEKLRRRAAELFSVDRIVDQYEKLLLAG